MAEFQDLTPTVEQMKVLLLGTGRLSPQEIDRGFAEHDRQEREKTLAPVLALHPTGRVATGSGTHGGATTYGTGCMKHGAWCPEWTAIQGALSNGADNA